MHKPASIAALLILGTMALFATEPESIVAHIQASGNITISQPAALDSLLQRPTVPTVDSEDAPAKTATPDKAAATRSGYRIQVYEDNNPRTARQQAEAYNARVTAEFPNLRTYVSFNSPYWRVKAGDFRTRAEAESVLNEMKESMPGIAAYMRIVRDKINIFD